jgi:PIN domain nuclease of toxin-antitoxin system
MRALLDTHAWLWFTGSSQRLGSQTRALLVDPANEVFLSLASAWEFSIKAGLGKVSGIGDPATFLRKGLARQRILPLGITLDHVIAVSALPAHHRDPFDRLLIVQAQAESLTIVTSDPKFHEYAVAVHDAST